MNTIKKALIITALAAASSASLAYDTTVYGYSLDAPAVDNYVTPPDNYNYTVPGIPQPQQATQQPAAYTTNDFAGTGMNRQQARRAARRLNQR